MAVGLSVGGVTKKSVLLVAANPDSMSAKAVSPIIGMPYSLALRAFPRMESGFAATSSTDFFVAQWQ